MAKKETPKTYIVTVEKKPDYCGVGAGGAQFANGQATITNHRLAAWFKAHKGYKVEEVKEAANAAE